ncbi:MULTISPECIES: hypothetical protein [unclassified Streptomyces]|uniref:hypothetical protein n=1 Tax=unclassified Streptomyces TaxID=2593676 RepID=UPI0035DC4DF3
MDLNMIERQREDVLTVAASVGGHIIGWADDWEVSGATNPMTRPKLGPWLRDERGPYDGLVAAAGQGWAEGSPVAAQTA